MSHLQPLQWEDFTGQGHLRAETDEGSWIIDSPPKFTDGQVKFHYQLPNPDRLDYFGFLRLIEATERDSREYWRLQNMLGWGYEGGYVPSQDDAKAVIDILRLPQIVSSSEKALKAAGFEFSATIGPAKQSDVFSLPLGEGSLSLLIQESGVHLAYRIGSERHSMMRIEKSYRFHWHDRAIPFFWPEAVEAQFQDYAVAAAFAIAERFSREERHLTIEAIAHRSYACVG